MLREYKFIREIGEKCRLLIWLKEIFYLLEIIEIDHYDFIENKVWIDLRTYNQAISKGINLEEVFF